MDTIRLGKYTDADAARVDILEKEYGVKIEEISQRGEGSELFTGRVK